ncbi:MAG: serine/threonine-protein kinase [Anaerolineales bacterium]
MATESLIGQTIGPYHILEQVGRGGMTVVYRARDLARERDVALKVLSPYIAQDPMFQARFRREIQVLQGVQHPHVVPILDFGEVEGTLFIVMPFLAAGTLQDRIKRRPLTPAEAMRIMGQVSSALQHAHDAGVVHRDVKPSNILMDVKGNALLSDFGFAQIEDTSLSLTGSALIGTPAFMSPEQCRGEEATSKSDQYSLGIVLYRLATGRLPFDADTPMGFVIKQINEPLPRPRFYSPNLPDSVEVVLIKALSKDPAHRFSSVAALNDAFQRSMRDALTPSGKLKMRSGVVRRPTQYFPDEMPTGAMAAPSRFWSGRRITAALLLLLFLGPASAWALNEMVPPRAGAQSVVVTPIGFEATVRAAVAAAHGGVSAEELQTAVAATLAAYGSATPPVDDPAPVPTASVTPTGGVQLAPGTGSPTTSFDLSPTRTSTPMTPSEPGTSSPTATRTPTATDTPAPTATAQPPTNTPAPTATCRAHTGPPLERCTPTPTP